MEECTDDIKKIRWWFKNTLFISRDIPKLISLSIVSN